MPVARSTRLGVTVAAACALALTAACGAGSKSGSAQATAVACDIAQQDPAVTVNVLAYDSSATTPFTNAMVASCSKNGVTVRHAPTDFSAQYQKTATTLAGNQGTYDIIEMYSAAVPRYAQTGKLLALDDLVAKYKDKYQLGDLNPVMIKGLSFEGKLYALPTQANITTLAYRKDIFDDLGLQPPKTYADLLEAAKKIQQSGKVKYPLALPLADNVSTLYEGAMSSQGLSYVDDAGKPTFDTPQAAKAVSALADLAPYMDPQVISYDQPRVQQQLFNGKAAMGIMFSGRMADLTNPKNTNLSDKFAFAAPPSVEPDGKSSASISADGWSIPKNSKLDPDLAFQLVAASVSADASKQAIPAAYPARSGIATDANVPYATAVQDALAKGAAPPPAQTWLGSMQSDTAAPIQRAIGGQLSTSAALAQAQTAAKAVLKNS